MFWGDFNREENISFDLFHLNLDFKGKLLLLISRYPRSTPVLLHNLYM